jgi:plasmid stability protein
MATTLTIRNVDPALKEKLRVRAARNAGQWKPSCGIS